MNNAIRHTWVVSVGLFITLFAALSIIQVGVTDELNANPNNVRQLYEDRGAPRGAITVDGTAIAESVPSDNSSFDYQRVYNAPELYSGITGTYSIANATGLERTLNEYLSGQSDSQFFDRIASVFTGDTMDGGQVELTLDGDLQQLAYDQIPDGTRGSIIVSEIATGDIKAMASKPSYDNNLLAVQDSSELVRNQEQLEADEDLRYTSRAISTTIAPGSTFKLIDLVAMLESGDYEPATVLENPNSITLPESSTELQNFERGICAQRPQAELSWIVAQSCNTPFAEAAMELGEDPIRESAEAFGWNSEDLEIPLEVATSAFPEDLSDAALAQSAIGQQSVTATPLQMNMVTSAIANGGTLMQPTLVDAIRGSDLQLLSTTEPEVLSDVTSEDVADEITEMMVGVVETGTATRAQTGSFDVAAKTGTAEIGDGTGEVNSWITGFAPADDPQYAVTVAYERIDYDTGSSLTAPGLLTMLEAAIE
ncbi:penicillin-binding transpeptidase domain-containing protein [Nesterenkonia halotolerans]|uniref:penicillin-binding transpeptidase domain-containing protein n=1 Tax=Nesterenkonia halotolerans TaxID=225325 RepID=UPI003EE522BA